MLKTLMMSNFRHNLKKLLKILLIIDKKVFNVLLEKLKAILKILFIFKKMLFYCFAQAQ